ncbi:MAG: hypothetical protein AB7I32_12435 [Gammaproteobacteria bacterium]
MPLRDIRFSIESPPQVALTTKGSEIMTSFENERATFAAVLVAVAFNGLFLASNGLFMLIAPLTWYEQVPGVIGTGFFNQHFIRDIGLIQMFMGIAFIVGLVKPQRRIDLWAAATLWLSGHALFHFWEVAVGICSLSAIPRDFPAVTLPALIGIALTLWAIRRARAGRTAFA